MGLFPAVAGPLLFSFLARVTKRNEAGIFLFRFERGKALAERRSGLGEAGVSRVVE